jgi:hypothetical protein
MPNLSLNFPDVVVASPDTVGKENTSSGHVAESNISKLYESRRLTEKNKVNQYSAPYSEVCFPLSF